MLYQIKVKFFCVSESDKNKQQHLLFIIYTLAVWTFLPKLHETVYYIGQEAEMMANKCEK